MIKVALTNKIVNALARKFVAKILAKRLGNDGQVVIDELSAVEVDGKIRFKVNAEIIMSSEAAESLIETF